MASKSPESRATLSSTTGKYHMLNHWKVRRIRGVLVVSGLLAAMALISACGHNDGDKPALQGTAATSAKADRNGFALA
ncbi:MAG: hypothetical protein ABW067_17470, partial [Rhizobacter sp.]